MPDPISYIPLIGITISSLWAAWEDLKTYSVPRYVWIPAAITAAVAVADFYMIDGVSGPSLALTLPGLYILGAVVLDLIGINRGDAIGLGLASLNLGYGVTGLRWFMWLAIWLGITLLMFTMMRIMTHNQHPQRIPLMVSVAVAVALTVIGEIPLS